MLHPKRVKMYNLTKLHKTHNKSPTRDTRHEI